MIHAVSIFQTTQQQDIFHERTTVQTTQTLWRAMAVQIDLAQNEPNNSETSVR